MKHLDLFSGIGGFALAAHWMGWETVQFVEIDKFCQKVLAKNFPNIPIHGDIKTFNGNRFRGSVDILTGGDPCQPNSVAGLRKGTSDVRFLWPEMFRIAEELQVPLIINENVSGSITNSVLDLKIDDLESIGYACWPYCIPAESVGALHQRKRVWLIAYNSDFYGAMRESREVYRKEKESPKLETKRNEIYKPWESVDLRITDTNTNTQRLQELDIATESTGSEEGVSRYFGFGTNPHGHITRDVLESGIIRMLDGLSEGMDYDGRNQRIKALGNSIVSQVAFEIFKAIEVMDKEPSKPNLSLYPSDNS